MVAAWDSNDRCEGDVTSLACDQYSSSVENWPVYYASSPEL